ncbi:unnamed protein product [Echinostoma caproni]|uniref:Uncharacterized protein n=1 Tax=Echinostoma caproni TaxID=27848 RepID=A0A3P8H384_9TREM|nr:unnamed protein product [Echinostoma caproni]
MVTPSERPVSDQPDDLSLKDRSATLLSNPEDDVPAKRCRTDADSLSDSSNRAEDPSAVWRTSAKSQSSSGVAKTQDEEFDEYFSDMLL